MGFLAGWNNGLNILVGGNSIRSYLLFAALFLGILLVLIVARRFLVRYLGKVAKRTVNDFDDFLVDLFAGIGTSVFAVLALYFASMSLVLPKTMHVFIRYAMVIVLSIRAVRLLQHVIQYALRKTYARRAKTNDGSAELMTKSLSGIFSVILWGVGGVFVLGNLGVNISTLVAGIGIGGIAVALAAQAVLGDAFSALCIFLDKPFEIGDFIILDDNFLGSVEHIGIKTTRIRSLFGEELIFANSDLTKSRIKNYKRMQVRRIDFTFNVVYETPLDKLQKIPSIVREIFSHMEGVRLDRVHFQSFGTFALVYEVVYYVNSADYNIYMDKQQQINFTLMEIFQKENISLAYPTQTLYVKKDA